MHYFVILGKTKKMRTTALENIDDFFFLQKENVLTTVLGTVQFSILTETLGDTEEEEEEESQLLLITNLQSSPLGPRL